MGSVLFDGQNITQISKREWLALRRRIQLVYQNPYASLNPRLSFERIICEPLQAFAVGDAAWRRILALDASVQGQILKLLGELQQGSV